MIENLNYTSVPNTFIDDYMSRLSPAATMIFLAICRKTIGWHKTSDRISYSQLREITGIVSHNTLKKGTDELINAGLVTVHRGTGKTSIFDICISDTLSKNDIDPVNNCTGTVSNFDNTKERKETSQKKDARDTRIKHLIDFFYETYESKTGRKPTVTGMWGKSFKRLLMHNSEDEIKAVITYFFGYNGRTQFSMNNFLARFDNLAPSAIEGKGFVKPIYETHETTPEEAERVKQEWLKNVGNGTN